MSLLPESIWPPTYIVKRHRKAKYVKLRAVRSKGLVVTIPFRFNAKQVPSIIEENRAWIEKQLANLVITQVTSLPETIYFQCSDETWKIDYVVMKARLSLVERHQLKEVILLGDTASHPACRIKLIAWIKMQAKTQLTDLLNQLSEMTQLKFTGVTIRNQKTLWGSCNSDKTIHLNYKLIFLPLHLVKHVIIHELCHTVYLNHSRRFWHLVGKHDGDWKRHRKELRHADNFIPDWIG